LGRVQFGDKAKEVSKQYDKIGRFSGGVAVVWKSGKCGVITQAGKEIIKPEYDRINTFGNDGLALTWKNGLVGMVNIQGKVIVPNEYQSIGRFSGAYAITRKNGLAGMINKQGKVVIKNEYEKITIHQNGIIRGVKNGKEVILSIKD
jgi:hypothetical protein